MDQRDHRGVFGGGEGRAGLGVRPGELAVGGGAGVVGAAAGERPSVVAGIGCSTSRPGSAVTGEATGCVARSAPATPRSSATTAAMARRMRGSSGLYPSSITAWRYSGSCSHVEVRRSGGWFGSARGTTITRGARAGWGREIVGDRTVSVGELIIATMRIRTLLGPPLSHEIVRDTATAIVLSMTHEKPASSQADALAARTPRPVRPVPCKAVERDTRAR